VSSETESPTEPDVDSNIESQDLETPERHQPSRTRTREVKLPKKLSDYQLYTAYCFVSGLPSNYDEAMNQGSGWSEAIEKEVTALKNNDVWTTCDLPHGAKSIDTRWVFSIKPDGTKKARLVAKGFQEEVYNNVYSPVARMPTIRLMISTAFNEGWNIKQLDIPTAFLNAELDKDTYIKTPQGVKSESGKVLKLNRSLYGLKSASRLWNEKLNDFLVKQNLIRSCNDFCLYYGERIYFVVWVDDIIITGDIPKVDKLVDNLKKEFHAKDIGKLNNFLGTQIEITNDKLKISQKDFIDKVLVKFNMEDCKGISTPMEKSFQIDPNLPCDVNLPVRQLIGSLMYISSISRPDIAFATTYLSRFVHQPTKQVWNASKRILRYLKATKHLSLTYPRSTNCDLVVYCDADWAGDVVDRKSVSGAVFFHGSSVINWFSRKQSTVALSTAEAEYVACANAAAETLYISGVHGTLYQDSNYKIPVLYTDNQSAISMAESFDNSHRSRHIDIKVQFVKDIVSKGKIKLDYISTNDNVADMFTKSLSYEKFKFFRDKLNVCE